MNDRVERHAPRSRGDKKSPARLFVLFQSSCAADGLEQRRSFRPPMLVSDIGTPDMDGYQFIREVRRLLPDKGGVTPAIALTAFARSEDRTRSMIAGYQMHLTKPIEPQELVVAVGTFGERRRT